MDVRITINKKNGQGNVFYGGKCKSLMIDKTPKEKKRECRSSPNNFLYHFNS